MMKTKQRCKAIALCVAALLMMTACGGGGASDGAAQPVSGLAQSQTTSGAAQASDAPEMPETSDVSEAPDAPDASKTPEVSQAPAPTLPVEPVWVVQPKYDVLNAFYDGDVTTAKRDGDWYLLDKTGKELKRLPFDQTYLAAHVGAEALDDDVTKEVVIYSFMGGLAKMDERHSDGNSAALGFIDETGAVAIDLAASKEESDAPITMVVGSKAGAFSGEYVWEAPASVMAWNQDTFKFIDKSGETAFYPPQGEIYRTRSFSEGLCGQVMADGSIRYLNSNGEIAFTVEGSYSDCGDMKNGYAWFTTTENTEGLLDKTGKVVLAPAYAAVGDVNEEGICSFADPDTGLRGLMKTDGTVVLPATYKVLYTPNEGVAYFSLDGETYGLINTQGDVVVEPRMQRVSTSKGGVCMAQVDGKWGFFKNPLMA